jgi:UDP-glucose 4-epimerase
VTVDGRLPDEVLVTGASGFIGTALGERLLDAGVGVAGVDVEPNRFSEAVDDVTEQLDIQDGLDSLSASPDAVVHLAATSRVGETVDRPARAVENVSRTRAVLDLCRSADARLVLASSREVYGRSDTLAPAEEAVSLDDCANPYGASKLADEALCTAYERCYGVDAVRLRFSNVYGRYDANPRVVPTFVALGTAGEELTVFGDEKILDFVHVDDAVDAVVETLATGEAVGGEAFNVGSSRGTPLVELARRVVETVPECPGYTVGDGRTGEVDRFVADVEKARRALGYEPTVSLADGLGRTVEWYRDHPALLAELGD